MRATPKNNTTAETRPPIMTLMNVSCRTVTRTSLLRYGIYGDIPKPHTRATKPKKSLKRNLKSGLICPL